MKNLLFTENTAHNFSKDQLEQRELQKNMFSNRIVGSFTPYSTIVEVDRFRTQRVRDASKSGNLLPVRRDIQFLYHEMTHWFDFFGTIWGRDYIEIICRGYLALERQSELGAEERFPDILALFDETRRILFPDYYRYSRAPSVRHDETRPWSIDRSSGLEFDPDGSTCEDRPFFAVRYGENPSRDNFARQPLSVGTLIEARAKAAEINAAYGAINMHSDQVEQLTERNLVNEEFNELAYDHNRIEYNTAAHLLSYQSGSKEILVSFQMTAALAFIALNLSKEDFERLKEPEIFKSFGERNIAFKKNQDRGYAFACMVFNGGVFDGDEETFIEKCVTASNLGSVSGVLERAAETLKEPFQLPDKNDTTDHFSRETTRSKNILEVYSKLPNYTLVFGTLESTLRTICPPFIDADKNFIELSKGRLDEYQPRMMQDESNKLHKYTYNFLTGCRGFPTCPRQVPILSDA